MFFDSLPTMSRLARLRRTPTMRSLLQETHLRTDQLVAPLFISEFLESKREIKSMPGQFQLSLNCLPAEIESLHTLGITSVILFGIPKEKDEWGSSSLQDHSIIQQAIRKIRACNSEILIIADVCFCEYTNHGHCGALKEERIDTEKTLSLLGQQAVLYAEAGADWVAPSSMTDGMVAAIRNALDNAGYCETAILSYAAKYASAFYGPFREAAEGAPQFGDRKAYQMNPANALEACREAAIDLKEGADMIMVKPAMNYLDVIFRIKQRYPDVPLCAYQVSGEYAFLKHAAMLGLVQEEDAILESLLSIKRAGADFIISYFAKAAAYLLKN